MTWSKRLSPPLWARILAIVVGALAAAQVVTLVLTVFFPPAPPSQYSLSDIGAALRGGDTPNDRDRPLVLSFEDTAPSLASPGWVVSPAATRDLAKLVGAAQTDVRLLFYAPPPLAGAPMPPPPARAEQGRSRMITVGQAGGAGGSPSMPMGGPGRMPGGGPMGRSGPMGQPGGAFPPSQRVFQRPSMPQQPQMSRPMTRPSGSFPDGAAAIRGPSASPAMGSRTPVGRPDVLNGPARGPIIRSPLDAAVFARPAPRFVFTSTATTEAPARTAPVSTTVAPPAPVVIAPAAAPPVATPEPIEPARPVVEPALTRIPRASLPKADTPLPAPVAEHTLPPPSIASGFSLGRAPYVEGEFVAAMKMGDGRWATVRPRPEGFPNSWQRRVLLWFGLSVALIAPLALFVAWRLAAPLKVFAESADRLGREPSADLPPLSGPAEIGKAADAFNLMQQRLKRYVDDRTGMIRAISHDLRTPLTRMRFKLERASPALRQAIGRDMDQMEEMIASVLAFMRDETHTATRQVVDLRSLLEVVVDDASGAVKLEPGVAVLAEIDVVGVQRVVENLIDNALKYGEQAAVSLDVRNGEAFIEVADKGPGLSPDDLEQAFQPFYRSEAARASGKSGVGLGLAVSRSTIRAHGGDLRLLAADQGLVAQLRLPQARSLRAAA
ncbi:ATP-binding protein [Caulobacter sp.]|uniref:sensor histidine kinase n=1 Tax=Caulobacter sp. TaxID=78 RepID=UPI001B0C2381|nr:ATP-binding protein [Caulobacter sp.]MBO9544407.1 HAMP domain-containing protein [Caulobacter sp.]